VEYSMAPVMTRVLIYQRFGHCSDDILDIMCHEQTIVRLTRVPPPHYEYDCPFCSLGKLPQFRKGKTASTDTLKPGELLHIDFAFWDITSRCMFTSVLAIIEAKTRMIHQARSPPSIFYNGYLPIYIARSAHLQPSLLTKM
jgi:hypothetical protein